MAKATKTFVRFDSNGNIVPGSMINATKKPANGSWLEITDNKQCCNPYTAITSGAITFGLTNMKVTISGGYSYVFTFTDDPADADAAVDILNSELFWLGTFVKTTSTTITLKMKQTIYNTFASTPSLTIASA